MSDGAKRVRVAAPGGDTSRLISSVITGAGLSVVAAGNLRSACLIASSEPIDLVILDYDLFANDFPEAISDTSKLFTFPRLIVVAHRDTWGACDDAGIGRPPEILWKPLDPETLLAKTLQKIDPAAAQ